MISSEDESNDYPDSDQYGVEDYSMPLRQDPVQPKQKLSIRDTIGDLKKVNAIIKEINAPRNQDDQDKYFENILSADAIKEPLRARTMEILKSALPQAGPRSMDEVIQCQVAKISPEDFRVRNLYRRDLEEEDEDLIVRMQLKQPLNISASARGVRKSHRLPLSIIIAPHVKKIEGIKHQYFQGLLKDLAKSTEPLEGKNYIRPDVFTGLVRQRALGEMLIALDSTTKIARLLVAWSLNENFPNKNAFDNIIQDLFRACRVGYDMAAYINRMREICKAKVPVPEVCSKLRDFHVDVIKRRCRYLPLMKGGDKPFFDENLEIFESYKSSKLHGPDLLLVGNKFRKVFDKMQPIRGISNMKGKFPTSYREAGRGFKRQGRRGRGRVRCFFCGGNHYQNKCPNKNPTRVKKE